MVFSASLLTVVLTDEVMLSAGLVLSKMIVSVRHYTRLTVLFTQKNDCSNRILKARNTEHKVFMCYLFSRAKHRSSYKTAKCLRAPSLTVARNLITYVA